MRDLTFYLVNTSPLPVPRLDVNIGTLYYRPIEAADLPSLLIQKLDGQDRLTEIGHSVDTGVFQAFRGFVLSMCCCWLTPLANMLAIDGEFLSCSMDTGFIHALPWGPWTWQCRSFDEDHFGRMAMVGEPIREIKNACARTLAENVPAIHKVKSAILCGQNIMSVAVIKLP